MRTLVLGFALASAIAYAQPRPVTAFDPVGKWTYSTRDDEGVAISGTMEIAGTPGAYTGTIASAPDRVLQVSEVLTSPNGMVVLADLPNNGGVAVIKVWKGADGKLQGGWGPIRSVIPATVEKANEPAAHSALRTVTGSTRVALAPGTSDATIAATASSAAMAATTDGSPGLTS